MLDASALIDLKKANLLTPFAALECQHIVPKPVRRKEVRNFTSEDWRILDDGRMLTYDLLPDEVTLAEELSGEQSTLSTNDCFCYYTAVKHSAILLTGDAQLRLFAQRHDIEVHGVLWVIDVIVDAQLCSETQLIRALESWKQDPSVRLPQNELESRIKVLKNR